jgi:thiamine biosynthesis lipoprotein
VERILVKKRKSRTGKAIPLVVLGRLLRFLVQSQLLTIFLVFCLLGAWVGFSTRPDPEAVPYGELFDNMSVLSYRESPSDSVVHFLIALSAGGKVFAQYDIEAQRFQPPPRGRDYHRAISGTHYGPLRVRGHVADGLWIEVPDSAHRSLLQEQLDELYRSTLEYVKPVNFVTDAVGTFSGYSLGYRLGSWSGSLSNRTVQERVLATPGLGRTIAREAWRRVLLEPAFMGDETNAARFAAIHSAQRLYTNFFRTALNDSDGFIPREAERLQMLGRVDEARAMLDFTIAVRRLTSDSVQVTSADFTAIERWASLLDRRGHWAHDAVPPAGEERVRYLGTLAWYGLAPAPPHVDRVWVGPRMLVRQGETQGFVADEILATRVGCPISWRSHLGEERRGATALANAWLSDRPEFTALAMVSDQFLRELSSLGRDFANRKPDAEGPPSTGTRGPVASTIGVFTSGMSVAATPAQADSLGRRSFAHTFRSMGTYANVVIVTADSAAVAPDARAAQAVFARVDSLMSNWTTTSEIARINREEAAGSTGVHPEVAAVVETSLRVGRESQGAFDITVEPLLRAWGFLGGKRHVPSPAERDSAFARVGWQYVVFDSATRVLRFTKPGVKIDLGGIAKGYAVDVAAETLRTRGITDALVDISGNMVGLGAPAHADRWRIGIRDPRDRVPHFARLFLAPGQAISTSGKYEQFVAADGKTYGHIMDPRTGQPAEGLISVTVLAPSATLADAWSTSLFVVGPAEAKRLAKERPDLLTVLIEPGPGGVDVVWVEEDLKPQFELEPQAEGRFQVEYF